MLWIWTILACDSGCHVIFIFYLSLFILALCSLHLKVCTRWACQKFLSFLIVLSCCYVLTVVEELSILIGIFCWLIISFNIWFSFLHFAFVRQFTDISLVEIALKRILLVCLLIITCFQLFISVKLSYVVAWFFSASFKRHLKLGSIFTAGVMLLPWSGWFRRSSTLSVLSQQLTISSGTTNFLLSCLYQLNKKERLTPFCSKFAGSIWRLQKQMTG